MALTLVAAATTFALAVLPGSLEDQRTVPAAEAPPALAFGAIPAVPEAPAPLVDEARLPAVLEPPKAAESPLGGLLLPGGALLALGGVALLFTLRKTRTPGSLRIIESVSVGPKRSLVVARVGDDELVLGCSEAGISLLSTRSGGAAAAGIDAWPVAAGSAGAPPPAPGDDGRPMGAPHRANVSNAANFANTANTANTANVAIGANGANGANVANHEASYLRRSAAKRDPAPQDPASALARLFGKGKARGPSFDDLLADSAQDQELRRRLAAGGSGRIG